MQTLSWYVRRLQAMTADEIAWRARSTLRNVIDRYRAGLKLYPRTRGERPRVSFAANAPRLCPVPRGSWTALPPDDPAVAWRDRLVTRADRITAHRLSFFDLDDVSLGNPIDWHRELAAGRPTPRSFSAGIDYRDYAVTGDAKVAWEPNRHHQLVVLGRAYRATGDPRYAAAVVEQIDSWIDQCPFGYGMQWRSPLELAIRIINWTWAIDLIADSGALTAAFDARLLQTVHLHVWDIARKYSRGSSANNHRIGEACGIFVATSFFPDLPDAARLRGAARRILIEEIERQTYASGATREQAFGYHLFVLQFFVVAALVGRRSSTEFPPAFWTRLERMFAFAGTLTDGGPPPFYGDADDGYVLDLGDAASDVTAWMQVGAALFDGSALERWRTRPSESAHWLFGTTAESRRACGPASSALESIGFDDAGCYLLQWGDRASSDRVSVVFDCGELGFGSLAAHGHADALGVVVRAGGMDLLVDPGTYDYFTFPEWRAYFRSTRAHNTVAIDRHDQSAQLGLFLWGRRAGAQCLDWRPRAGGGSVVGEHDGYQRLSPPVRTRRTLDLDRARRTLTITDDIDTIGQHEVALHFLLAEHCDATIEGQRIAVSFPAGRAVIAIDARLSVSMRRGQDGPDGGWVSRGYHRKSPAWAISASTFTTRPLTLRTIVEFGELSEMPAAAPSRAT